jgi:hypothetical protein
MDVSAINVISLCTRRIDDFWSWQYEKHGNFSVRSAYRMLSHTKYKREAWLDGKVGVSNNERSRILGQNCGQLRFPQRSNFFFGDLPSSLFLLLMCCTIETCLLQAHAAFVVRWTLFVQRFLSEIEEAKTVSTSHNPARNHQVTSDPQWIPPSYGYVFFLNGVWLCKVKVDGAVSQAEIQVLCNL